MRWLPILVLLFCLRAAPAQNPSQLQSALPKSATLQLSPQAAYDRAYRPLDIVRKPVSPDLKRKSAGASAFLLFPDWCAQCVAMDTLFVSTAASLKQERVRFYALLAQANPRPPAPKLIVNQPARTVNAFSKLARQSSGASTKGAIPHIEIQAGTKINVADQLVGTSTLIVPNDTLDIFVATDFPLLIVTHPHGIVRYIQTAPQNALVEGGLIYQVAQRVLKQWPAPSPR